MNARCANGDQKRGDDVSSFHFLIKIVFFYKHSCFSMTVNASICSNLFSNFIDLQSHSPSLKIVLNLNKIVFLVNRKSRYNLSGEEHMLV